MKNYKVTSGENSIIVTAENNDDAAIKALKDFPLEKCSQFIQCLEQGKDELLDSTFGLTEWYLPKAGYEVIGDHLYRKIEYANMFIVSKQMLKEEAVRFSKTMDGINKYYVYGKGKKFIVVRDPKKEDSPNNIIRIDKKYLVAN